MNIVICCTLNASSHSKQFQILAEDLVKEGHTVIFVSDKQRTQESDYNNLTFLHWPNYTPTKLQDFFFIYKLLKKFKTDVLFTNFSAVNLSLLAAYLVGVKKRIAWLRSVSIDGYSLIGMLKRFRKSLIYGFGTEIVIVSKAILKELKLEYLINKNKVQLIPNAVETLNKNHILGLRQRRNYITCVATLEYWKGHDILINAFRKICCHYPHFELLIIGSGSREKELEGLIEKHNLKESVFLLGQLHPEDLYHYLQLSLFSVLPSRRDATPKVILESMRFGTPVIGSDIEGISNMIKDGKEGLLFRTEDADDLAEKMIHLIDNPGKWESFHNKILETFNDKHSVNRWIIAVKNLIE